MITSVLNWIAGKKHKADVRSPLVDFLTGSGLDYHNRSHESILRQSDQWWEASHNHIQWMFPTVTPSSYNFLAPVLTPDDIFQITQNKFAKLNIYRGAIRYLKVLGIEYVNNDFRWINENSLLCCSWVNRPDHNDLRISRLLESLTILRHSEFALKLFEFLRIELKDNSLKQISLTYWKHSVQS